MAWSCRIPPSVTLPTTLMRSEFAESTSVIFRIELPSNEVSPAVSRPPLVNTMPPATVNEPTVSTAPLRSNVPPVLT